MRRSLFTILACFGLFALSLGNATITRASTVRTLTFYCENGYPQQDISSGNVANYMPNMYMSLTAQYSMDADPAPNLTLNFYVTDISNSPSSLVALDRTSDTTNSDGKCRVIINGSGTTVSDGTLVRVHVKRVNTSTGQTVIDSSVVIKLRQYNTTTADTPWVGPAISPGTSIGYNDSLLTKMDSYASQSLSDWTVTSRITFTQNNSTYKLIFQEIDAGTFAWYGQTINPDTPNTWGKIQYNMYILDSDWVTPHRAWAPLGWRHYVQTSSDHEVGHYLGLAHNDVFDKALMCAGPNGQGANKYFVWGTVTPRTQDWNPILAHY